MTTESGVTRALRDIESGRLWKARDRLHGVIASNKSDQEALDLLGQAYFDMGDLPQAGRYWYLTTRNDERSKLANQAFEERFGMSALSRADSIRFRGPIRDYPEEVGSRLTDLEKQVKTEVRRTSHRTTHARRPVEVVRDFLVVTLIVVLTVGVWLAGLIAIIIWSID